MADVRVDDLDTVNSEQLRQLPLEPERIEAVRGDPGDAHLSLDPGGRRLGSAVAAAKVEMVHRLAEHQVTVGVETADHLVPVVLEIGLDRIAPAP